MRLWKARSVTYKTHFFSALCRGIFTNSCWIFGTSLLVKVVGSKSFPQLYFYASLLSLIYYIYFAMRGHKGQEPYNVYRLALLLALITSAGCFAEPFCAFLQPFNEPLLFLFVVSVMTVDLIGTTVGPIVLQQSVNPAIFRQVYQTIVTSEGLARVAAAALVWLLSQGHLLACLYPIAWLMLILHFILFGVTIWRMRVSELRTRARSGGSDSTDTTPGAFDNVSASLRFLMGNPLVRIATIIMVWSIITKFVIEYLFYQVADTSFPSARQIASFVSVLTMTIYILSLVVHHLITRRLTSKLQLSTLLSIQPINIVVLGALALLLPPFWPMVLLMVTYNIIHRSVQLPMSRQCLVPVPRKQRGTIVSLISMIIAVATITISGSLAALKGTLHLQDVLVMLLLLGSAIFFVVTGLDSYYIRNLWSFLKEVRSGSWEEEPQSENLSFAELECEDAIGSASMAAANADLRSHPILETYAFSFDRKSLAVATGEHRRLLDSTSPEFLVPGLRVSLIAGFPWFAPVMARATEHGDGRVRQFARHAMEINKTFAPSLEMSRHSSVFRRRIKAVAIDMLEDAPEGNDIALLERLSKFGEAESAEEIVAVLADRQFAALKNLILECACGDGGGLSVRPIIDRMFELDYQSAENCRELLKRLPFGKSTKEVRAAIEVKLSSMSSKVLALSRKDSDTPNPQLRIFLHTLFLEEYRLSPRESDGALMDSVSEFEFLSQDERGIFLDMHLSFLKKSEFFKYWQDLTEMRA